MVRSGGGEGVAVAIDDDDDDDEDDGATEAEEKVAWLNAEPGEGSW